jgi:MerR family mercuric resistance operon transcriptional regulator
MTRPNDTLTIGAVAAAAGVNGETIRFYQRRGLLRTPERPPGGVRRYSPGDAARVRFIKSAQRVGFSLDEVAQLLQLEETARAVLGRARSPRTAWRTCASGWPICGASRARSRRWWRAANALAAG